MSSSPASGSAGLWAFATALYGCPGLEAVFLRLQDESGLDVPLLIALAYAGKQGRRLSPAGIAGLRAVAEGWQSRAVRPLRRIRRDLKTPVEGVPDEIQDAFRARIKAAELEAERVLLERLETLLPPAGEDASLIAIQANLKLYSVMLSRALKEGAPNDLTRIAEEAAAL